MIPLIEQRRADIAELCRRHAVRRLDLFGSAARGGYQAGCSDLDFLVEFARSGYPGYADTYLNFAEGLESLLRHRVDLVTPRMIRTPAFRAAVETSRELVYEDRSPAAAA
jgi:uncharacterized protein